MESMPAKYLLLPASSTEPDYDDLPSPFMSALHTYIKHAHLTISPFSNKQYAAIYLCTSFS